MGEIKMENFSKEAEWKDETEERKIKLVDFLKNYFENKLDLTREAYSFTELQFSGENPTIFQGIKQGTAKIDKVNVFYGKNSRIERIHILYKNESQGPNVDVYLTGKAISDFLNF